MVELIETLYGNMITASHRHQARERLSRLADRHLRDIGLERDDIPAHVDATIPWVSRRGRPAYSAEPSMQALG